MRDEFARSSSVRATLEEIPARRATDAPDLGIVPPDKPPVQVQTNDRTIQCKICKNDLVVSQATIDKARDENGRIMCPNCHLEHPIDNWVI